MTAVDGEFVYIVDPAGRWRAAGGPGENQASWNALSQRKCPDHCKYSKNQASQNSPALLRCRSYSLPERTFSDKVHKRL